MVSRSPARWYSDADGELARDRLTSVATSAMCSIGVFQRAVVDVLLSLASQPSSKDVALASGLSSTQSPRTAVGEELTAQMITPINDRQDFPDVQAMVISAIGEFEARITFDGRAVTVGSLRPSRMDLRRGRRRPDRPPLSGDIRPSQTRRAQPDKLPRPLPCCSVCRQIFSRIKEAHCRRCRYTAPGHRRCAEPIR